MFLLNVIDSSIVLGGAAVAVMQCRFFNLKSRFSTFAALKKNQRDRPALPMTNQSQPFGFKSFCDGTAAQLTQPFRFMDQIEVPTIAQ